MQEILSFVLDVIFLYRFEPEHAPNAEDSENEEVSDRLGGTFWCTCERCETMPTQTECVCCREQPESENKMVGGILSLYCIGRSKWKNNFLCKLPSLDIKRRFNKAVSSSFFYLNCLYFYFTSWRCHEGISCHCKQRIFDGLFKPSGARNCDSRLPLLQQIAFTFTNAESVRV